MLFVYYNGADVFEGRKYCRAGAYCYLSLARAQAPPFVEAFAVGEAAVQGAPAFSLRIANSEYDLNGHVSNIKYADYIFNCFFYMRVQ